MKTTYYIIEKSENLVKLVSDNFTSVYVSDLKGNISKPFFYKSSLAEAKKQAKACGMDVVVYVGSEFENSKRVYVS